MPSPLNDVKRSVYLWSYVLAELVPFTRQRLHLTSIPERAKSDHCNSGSSSSCRCTLDESSTRELLLECTSRRLSLDSILLASLFLATSEAVRIENQQNDTTTRAGGVRGTAEKAMAMKLHKSLVLGVVCVVMAMLSGSVESKAMRYFCSLYAVVAGIWAVNVITIERPGRTIIMATSTTIKVGIDAAEETFTPVRLSVDCGQDLWDTADRLHRQSRRMACSMSSYARFKMHVRHARRLGTRHLERQETPSEEAKLTDSTYRPLQLFGCIRLEGTGGDRREHQLAPEETPPGSPSCTSIGMTTEVEGDRGMASSSDVKTASKSASALNEGGTPLRSELILTTLDSKYTLFYRETTVVIDGDGSEHEATASGGDVEVSKTLRRTAAPPPPPPPMDQDESRSRSRLELTLVEGTRALRGSGSDWLLDRSKAILLQGIRDVTGNDP